MCQTLYEIQESICNSYSIGIVWPNAQTSEGRLPKPNPTMTVCQHPWAYSNADANPLLGQGFRAIKPCKCQFSKGKSIEEQGPIDL